MAKEWFNPAWIGITVVITALLFIILLPKMLAAWGPVGAVTGTLALLIAMGLTYMRGYWIGRWIEERRKRRRAE